MIKYYYNVKRSSGFFAETIVGILPTVFCRRNRNQPRGPGVDATAWRTRAVGGV